MSEKKEKFSLGFSQKAIIFDPVKKKFLLVKVRDKESNYFKDYGPWELVGGTLNDGENLEDSFKREIKEEAGDIDFKILQLVEALKLEVPSREKIMLGYLVEYRGGEIKLNDEHSEYKWESAEDVEKNSEYRQWLKQFIKNAAGYLKSTESLDGWKRCLADFENYKKMQAQAQKDFAKFAAQDLIMQVLPVLDNFHASTDHVPVDQKSNPWVVGIMHIQKQLEQVVRDSGVEEIAVKEGDEFDPTMHEAVEADAKQRTESESTNKIRKILSKGYKMGDKIIRPARVAVG